MCLYLLGPKDVAADKANSIHMDLTVNGKEQIMKKINVYVPDGDKYYKKKIKKLMTGVLGGRAAFCTQP
jgi:hypothetical protein